MRPGTRTGHGVLHTIKEVTVSVIPETPSPVVVPESTRIRGTLMALTASGVVLAVNAVVLGAPLFLDSRPFSEIAVTPLHFAFWSIQLAGLVVLSQVYPRLHVLEGPDGRRLPEWALWLLGVGVVLDAATRFLEAFAVPAMADAHPGFIDNTPPAMLLVPLLGAGVVHMAGLLALGVYAFRRRILPRPAAVLIAVGGLAVPTIGPVAGLLLGAGLAWAGAARLRQP